MGAKEKSSLLEILVKDSHIVQWDVVVVGNKASGLGWDKSQKSGAQYFRGMIQICLMISTHC